MKLLRDEFINNLSEITFSREFPVMVAVTGNLYGLWKTRTAWLVNSYFVSLTFQETSAINKSIGDRKKD